MATQADISRYKTNWQAETDAAAIYRALADMEPSAALSEVYRRMAIIEENHIRFWAEKLQAAGVTMPQPKPTLRARITIWLAKKFGSSAILPTLAATETQASTGYDGQPEVHGTQLSSDEKSHARILRTIAGSPVQGMEGGSLARLEGRHKAVGGNALRASVLGANDGLCSSLSLVMGVAGATHDPRPVMVAGVAGLLAGACAMAMGEWLSVQSARELAERQIAVEADELKETPEEEQEELALIYQAKGLSKEDAQSLAAKLIADEKTALGTLAREELGIDPEELGGSAWEAAFYSFFLFIIGAIAPVTPFVLAVILNLPASTAIIASIVCSGVALFLIGGVITLMTGRGLFYSGMRQLLIGAAAASVTYGIGRLIGIAID